MLWSVTLTYIRPKEEIAAHLDSHRAWLVEQIRAGRILAAGPAEPPGGGMVLAHCADRAELDRMLATDSFSLHGLVEHEVRAFQPMLRAAQFAEVWAPRAAAF